MNKLLKVVAISAFLLPVMSTTAKAIGVVPFKNPAVMVDVKPNAAPLVKVRRVRIPVYIPGGGSSGGGTPWMAYLFGGMIVIGIAGKLMKKTGASAGKVARKGMALQSNKQPNNDLSEDDIEAMIAKYKNGSGTAQTASPLPQQARDISASRPDFGTRNQPVFGKRQA